VQRCAACGTMVTEVRGLDQQHGDVGYGGDKSGVSISLSVFSKINMI
jgi:hypothetical protein